MVGRYNMVGIWTDYMFSVLWQWWDDQNDDHEDDNNVKNYAVHDGYEETFSPGEFGQGWEGEGEIHGEGEEW